MDYLKSTSKATGTRDGNLSNCSNEPSKARYQCTVYGGGGLHVFKGGYHARVQKHRKSVVFQGETRTAQTVFRVSKTAKIKKKVMVFLG